MRRCRLGTSLLELIHKFRHRTLVLLKMLMLQKRVSANLPGDTFLMRSGLAIRVSRGDALHISIFLSVSYAWSAGNSIPACALLTVSGLLMSLRDSGSPELDVRPGRNRPTSLRSSDRSSLLRYMGLRECRPYRIILKLIFS